MKRTRRVLAIILGLVMCLTLLAACDKKEAVTDNPPSSPDVSSPASPVDSPKPSTGDMQAAPPTVEDVKYAEELDIIIDNTTIAVLDPFSPAANTSSTNWVFTMIYDRLVERNHETGEYLPALATEWHTDDYKSFTFKLRDDVYFQNGEKFTAEDVAYTIGLAREGVGSQGAAQWAPVESFTVISPTEIQLDLKAVNVDFMYNLALPMTGILNQKAVEANADNGRWIGTGPFSVSDFATNDYTVMERNDNYWGEAPITKKITLRLVPEMSTRTIMMQNGESHACFSIGSEDLEMFLDDSDNFSVFPVAINHVQGLIFNLNDPLMSDYNLRMAITHAINRAEIAIVAAGDWAVPVTDGTVWGYQTEFRNNNIPIIPHDLDKAKEYLELSNYNGEVIEISTAIITNIRASEAVQQQLAAIGINSTVNQLDAPGLAAYTAYDNNQSMMSFFGSTFNFSATSFRHLFYPGAAQNKAGYNNPTITEMLDEAAGTLDRAQREALFMEMQEIVAKDSPIVPVFWRINGVVAAAGVGGMNLPPDGHLTDLRYIYMVQD